MSSESRFERVFFDDLKIAEPDFVVEERKEEDVVNEGFEAAGGGGDGEGLLGSVEFERVEMTGRRQE